MVDIVIVNWNSGDLLQKCILSVLTIKNEVHIRKIYLIDNNSTDKSLFSFPGHEKILLIRNSENFGFAKACNQGFKLCTSPYVLLLNPDTQLLDNTIRDCINFMKINEDIDILGCQLLDDDGAVSPSCARFPTPFKLFIDATGLSKIAPKSFNPAILMSDWDHLQSRNVDQVMGAFMFMRTDIFKKLGYFDERFFVYFEELDFSFQLAKSGGKSFYNSDIKAIHTGRGTTEAIKAFRLFLYLRSKLQYAKKHFSFAGYSLVWLSTVIIEPITRIMLVIFKGKFNEIKDIMKGYKLLLRDLPIH